MRPSKCILLIDDNVVTREKVSMLLAGAGYRVAAAANGEEAMQRLHGCDRRPDLILLDLSMPVMDGRGFRDRQRQEVGLASIPVLVYSAAEDADQTAAALGAVGCVHKPTDIDALLDAVRRCCP